ncbi:hypothetical protein PVMG_04091 [Plasmodium vivax Mauritania I]|uniref:Uncharacterized protein n=1 Tax=Plasmodium vivax Mauritania I TaxID=1035515 RepID=A0A0J9T8D6_PLAVI|nr:hypothetical protein PVMG_04091 [Plasmodium vivax Mauritania I]
MLTGVVVPEGGTPTKAAVTLKKLITTAVVVITPMVVVTREATKEIGMTEMGMTIMRSREEASQRRRRKKRMI